MSKIAVVMVRGPVRIRHDVARSLRQLNLHKSNHAVIVEDSSSVKGQLHRIQSFVTWGPVNDETIKKISPRAQEKGKLPVVYT